MTRTIALLLVMLLGLSVTSYKLWDWGRQADAARVVAEERYAAAQKRLGTIQAQVQKSTTASQKARQDVKEKLDAAPAFRDTAVPVPVRDSLCERIRCK